MSESGEAIAWAGVLVMRDRKIFVLKEQDKPFYILPGGKVEPGETDEEAAIRELREEAGVSAHNLKPYTVINENSRTTGQLIRFKVFTGEMDQDPLPDNLPERTEGTAWINSSYKEYGMDVGNLLRKLIPMLIKSDLID